MTGSGLDQRKACDSFRRENLKVLISDGPGGWGCLHRDGFLWWAVVLTGVCRNGGS